MRPRVIIVSNVLVVVGEIVNALPPQPLFQGGLVDLIQIACSAGMATLAILEHVARRPQRHRWTVLFSTAAAGAALLGWSWGRQRLVDTVTAAALLVTAVMTAVMRPRR